MNPPRLHRARRACLAGALVASLAFAPDGRADDTAAPHVAEATIVAQLTNARQPRASVVVGKSRVPLVSSILDQQCANMVEPYDVLDNALTLGTLVTKASGEVLGSGKLTGDGVTHRLSKKTREEAMKLNWLPQSVERRFGEILHQRAVDANRIVPRSEAKQSYAKADAMLTELKADLPKNAYTFEIHVRNLPGRNATALPGGIIHVNVSVLDDEPLARFALAHEMAHIMKRHETRLTQARIIDALSLRGSLKEVSDAIRNPTLLSTKFLATLAIGKNIFARHFAGQELESDACAVRMLAAMSRLGLKDVDASVGAFLAVLPPSDPRERGSTAAARPDLIELVSNPIDVHPTPEVRRQNLMTVRADIGRSMKQPALVDRSTKPQAK